MLDRHEDLVDEAAAGRGAAVAERRRGHLRVLGSKPPHRSLRAQDVLGVGEEVEEFGQTVGEVDREGLAALEVAAERAFADEEDVGEFGQGEAEVVAEVGEEGNGEASLDGLDRVVGVLEVEGVHEDSGYVDM